MKIYTQTEATTLLRNNPILYTELAHQYPCCNIPIEDNCSECKSIECPINKMKDNPYIECRKNAE